MHSFLHKNRPDYPTHLILLVLLLLIDDQYRAEFFPRVEHVLLVVYLLSKHPLDLIGDALAQLVIFVDILVILRERVVGFGEDVDTRLQL